MKQGQQYIGVGGVLHPDDLEANVKTVSQGVALESKGRSDVNPAEAIYSIEVGYTSGTLYLYERQTCFIPNDTGKYQHLNEFLALNFGIVLIGPSHPAYQSFMTREASGFERVALMIHSLGEDDIESVIELAEDLRRVVNYHTLYQSDVERTT